MLKKFFLCCFVSLFVFVFMKKTFIFFSFSNAITMSSNMTTTFFFLVIFGGIVINFYENSHVSMDLFSTNVFGWIQKNWNKGIMSWIIFIPACAWISFVSFFCIKNSVFDVFSVLFGIVAFFCWVLIFVSLRKV